MTKKILFLFLVIVAFINIFNFTYAEESSPRTMNLVVRDGDSIIFSGALDIASVGTVDLNDNTGAPHAVNAESVLAALNTADALSGDFNISNLQYYSSFNSLYLKCINGPTGEKCDNWQYAINGSYPGVSMDQNVLSGGETVYIFYGSQYRVRLSGSSITTAETLTAHSEKYNYENNTWEARTGVTIGLTQANPDDPWTPIELETIAVDENGKATFSPISEGSYSVAVKEDFYFPSESLNVSPVSFSGGGTVSSSISSTPTPPSSKIEFNTSQALKFIAGEQKENGSFGEDLYTDWIALALASGGSEGGIIKLVKYLGGSHIENALITDYERRAMALMALGLNPYDTGEENYIEKIVNSFDGVQFGDPELVNDDIFALIVLQNAGYGKEDEVVNAGIKHILSKQKQNGSFEDSVDMTGAGIQAIYAFGEESEVKDSLVRAKEYLKQSQKDDGGWGNVSATTWAVGGILSLSEKPEDWSKNEHTPADFLALNQESDGGIKGELVSNRLWETAYAVAALSGKNWNDILQDFEKKIENKNIKEEKLASKAEAEDPVKPTKNESPKKITRIKKNKPANAMGQTASVISASNNIEIKEEGKKTWLRSFLEKIFSF